MVSRRSPSSSLSASCTLTAATPRPSRQHKEAKQDVKLIGKCGTIDAVDALQFLPSDFESEEVCAYAASVVERDDDEELHPGQARLQMRTAARRHPRAVVGLRKPAAPCRVFLDGVQRQ